MKTSTIVSSLFLGTNASIIPTPTEAQALQFVQGFLTSSLHYENLDGYVPCAVNAPLL